MIAAKEEEEPKASWRRGALETVERVFVHAAHPRLKRNLRLLQCAILRAPYWIHRREDHRIEAKRTTRTVSKAMSIMN